MKPKHKILISPLLLVSCLNSVVTINPSKAPLPPEPLETKVVKTNPINQTPVAEQKMACQEGMADIDSQFCIDKYEASIIDKNTIEYASPQYIPSQGNIYDANWQYDIFKNKLIPAEKLPQLIEENQPLSMPPRGAEQYPSFEPLAMSVLGRIPATYVNKIVAEQACNNAGKRLCTRKEWYRACVGPNGPSPYVDEKGKEIFPENRPYGRSSQQEKCNIGLQTDRWPPELLGRKNNGEMLDPRIGALLGKDGQPMKKATASFSECTNEYGVYDMLGNVHEIVSDIRIANRFPRERVTYVGSHYARSAKESCAETTIDHWKSYTDYSLGFRCCKNITP